MGYQKWEIGSAKLVAQTGTKISKYKVTERKTQNTLVNTQSLETDYGKTDRQTDRRTCSHKIAQAANTYKKK